MHINANDDRVIMDGTVRHATFNRREDVLWYLEHRGRPNPHADCTPREALEAATDRAEAAELDLARLQIAIGKSGPPPAVIHAGCRPAADVEAALSLASEAVDRAESAEMRATAAEDRAQAAEARTATAKSQVADLTAALEAARAEPRGRGRGKKGETPDRDTGVASAPQSAG